MNQAISVVRDLRENKVPINRVSTLLTRISLTSNGDRHCATC
ncbi:hypothetical protein [Nostoc sp. EfeVER01]|nr:hypothetical protein [Nostoc sp. EfeVER01]MDZ7947128.1 hypothetical protein [Nostoc sp. EfeVER01]